MLATQAEQLTVDGPGSIVRVCLSASRCGRCLQWWFGRYQAIEFADIAGNEIGLAIAWWVLHSWSAQRRVD